jgi:hypothetical protein
LAAPIVGENSIGLRFAWRSFQSVTIDTGRAGDGNRLLPRGHLVSG